MLLAKLQRSSIKPFSQPFFMKQHHDKLLSLIKQLPQYNFPGSANELSKILSAYKSILDTVNQIDDDYERNTNPYYSEISRIQSDIQGIRSSKSQRQKDQSFSYAVSGLRSDMEALADLINDRESFDKNIDTLV